MEPDKYGHYYNVVLLFLEDIKMIVFLQTHYGEYKTNFLLS